ncbi:MAG: hypothetical protein GY801_41070 [bacterium]|nr:hypothetical protein [bacterium]
MTHINQLNPFTQFDQLNPFTQFDHLNPFTQFDHLNPFTQRDHLNQVDRVDQVNHLNQPPLSSCPGIPYRLHGIITPQREVMTPPANRLIDLLKTHYPAFEQTHPLQEHVRQAVRLLTSCHTSALGGHLECCPNGHIERVFYNSCGHRFCPRCAGRKRRKWLLERQAKLLGHRDVETTTAYNCSPAAC